MPCILVRGSFGATVVTFTFTMLAQLNDCIGALLHLGSNVITFRALLHLGPNVTTFRTLLHLGQLHLGQLLVI